MQILEKNETRFNIHEHMVLVKQRSAVVNDGTEKIRSEAEVRNQVGNRFLPKTEKFGILKMLEERLKPRAHSLQQRSAVIDDLVDQDNGMSLCKRIRQHTREIFSTQNEF